MEAILEDGYGVLRITAHRSLRSTVWRLVRAGTLVSLFPGVYVEATRRGEARVWLAAVCAWLPDAVVTGATAIQLATGNLPRAASELRTVWLHRPTRTRTMGRLRCKRRTLAPDAVVTVAGIRFHMPAAAAVETAATDQGAAIDALLRTRSLEPESLRQHLAPHRCTPGNPVRRQVVAASMHRPYSFAERLLHRVLAAAGLRGWIANRTIKIGGRFFVPDVLFAGIRLIIECDGRQFHGGGQFETDRERQNLLVANGYTVLRVTWAMLQQPADLLAVIRQTLHRLRTAA